MRPMTSAEIDADVQRLRSHLDEPTDVRARPRPTTPTKPRRTLVCFGCGKTAPEPEARAGISNRAEWRLVGVSGQRIQVSPRQRFAEERGLFR